MPAGTSSQILRSEGRPVPPVAVVDGRGPKLPKWAQVLADLRRRLDAGEFEALFPTDVELVEAYGVSRHTVREAVRHLQAEGLLERYRGRGSFVVEKVVEQPVGTLYSLFRSVEESGMLQESTVRYLETRHDELAASMLGCPGAPLVYLERVRLADGEPLALDCSWMPASVAAPLLEADFTHTALYEQLAVRCGVRLTSGWERVLPVLPDRRQRQLLGLGGSQPAFSIERLARSGERPVEWRHGVVRSDRFYFVTRWSASQLDTGFEQGPPAPAGARRG